MAADPHHWTHMESVSETQERHLHPQWSTRSVGSIQHTVTFYLINPRHDEFQKLAEEIADPSSPMYGKHLTKQQVDEMVGNPAGMAIVEEYLHSLGATIDKKTVSSIEATAPISTWERAFNTEFHDVTVPHLPDRVLYRAKTYSLPQRVAQHVQMVMNTVQLPAPMHGGPVVSGVRVRRGGESNDHHPPVAPKGIL